MVEVYQLGDFVDLWREGFGNDPSNIIADNPSVCNLLLRGLRTSPTDIPVPVYCLRGNHDFSIMDWGYFGAWQRAYVFDDTPVVILHGDVLDWLEVWGPEWLLRAIVYLTGVRSGERNFSQEELQQGTDALNRQNVDSGRYLWASKYWLGTQLSTPPSGPTGPADDNVITVNDLSGHELMPHAYDLAQKFLSAREKRTRFMIIGHTHWPRIIRHQKDDDLFVLMDCGAWLEKYWVGPDRNIQPSDADLSDSQQIGVVIGNDLRIYQLD